MGQRAAALIIGIAISAGAVSCRDVFTRALGAGFVRTDLVLAWLLRPDGPSVTFTSPANGATAVALNQSVIVCFSEPVSLPEGADPFRVELIDESGAPLEDMVPTASELAGTGPGADTSDTIQVLPPEYGYEQNRRYRVVMAADIYTAQGEPVDPGNHFPLEFTTGDDGDDEPPRVTATVPLDYQSTGHERPVITAQFDDDVVPATGTLSIYRYDHAKQEAAADPEQIEYSVGFAGSTNSIAFTLRGDLEEYRIYQAVVSGVRDTSGNLMAANGAGDGEAGDCYNWRFFTGPVVVAVEPASNHKYGFGTFGNTGEYINGVVAGHELLDRTAAIIHGRVGEGGRLSTFFDATNGGGFPDDVSAIRILHNGRNLAGDLGLTPVCKTITGPNMAPPPGGVFYVDPRWGRFLLPRPAYWSRMESYENMTTGAECRMETAQRVENNMPYMRYTLDERIGNYQWGEEHVVTWLSKDEYGFGSVGGLPAGGKFGNCFTMFWESDSTEVLFARSNNIKSRNTLQPFGDQNITDYKQGTITFWGSLDTCVETHTSFGHESSGEALTELRIAIAPGLTIFIRKEQKSKVHAGQYQIRLNNTQSGCIDGMMMHFYITWIPDRTGSCILLNMQVTDAMNPENYIHIERSIESIDNITFKPYIEIFGSTSADCRSIDWFARSLARAWCRMDNLKWYTHNVGDDHSWEYNNGNGREEALHPIYGFEMEFVPILDNNSGVGYYFIPYIIH